MVLTGPDQLCVLIRARSGVSDEARTDNRPAVTRRQDGEEGEGCTLLKRYVSVKITECSHIWPSLFRI